MVKDGQKCIGGGQLRREDWAQDIRMAGGRCGKGSRRMLHKWEKYIGYWGEDIDLGGRRI